MYLLLPTGLLHRPSGRLPRLTRFLGVVPFLALALCPVSARAQECPQGRISYIFIDNRSIFPTSEMDPDQPFRWVYRLMNSLHYRTREEFVRKELLFKIGDCLDPFLLEESGRLLRSYTFIGQSDVFSLPQPDGTQHVNVYTQDEWTTRVDMDMRFDGGFQLNGLKVTEENFLGRGVLLRGFLEQEEARRDLGIEVQSPRLFNTRWDGRIAIGKTRNGNFFEEALSFPFVGEVGRFGARQTFLWRETLFPYAIPEEIDPDHSFLLVPFLDERADIAVGGRLGRPGNLTIYGMGISRESVRFRGFPEDVELVTQGNFSNTEDAGLGAVEVVEGQIQSRRANRINFFLGQRNLRFLQRRGLDALTGIQDIQVGAEVLVGFGRALGAIQEGGGLSSDDLHTQVDLFLGEAWDGWIFNTSASAEARQVYAGGGEEGRWEDIFTEGDMYLYWQPAPEGPHTVLLRVSGAGGWNVTTPYQLTLGGRSAVRGYHQERYPGARRVVMSLEERMFLAWPAPEVLDFGLSFFMDVGQIQAGGVPFGVDSGWRTAAGLGVRLGLPPGTARTTRIDLALPLGKRTQLKDLVLRISLDEVLGILSGVRDRQLLRSLRSGVRPYLGAPPW